MNKLIYTICLVFAFQCLFAHTDGHACNHLKESIGKSGISLGAAIAVAISWSRNKSVLWAILHGALSWFYVIYYQFKLKDEA